MLLMGYTFAIRGFPLRRAEMIMCHGYLVPEDSFRGVVESYRVHVPVRVGTLTLTEYDGVKSLARLIYLT